MKEIKLVSSTMINLDVYGKTFPNRLVKRLKVKSNSNGDLKSVFYE